MIIFLLTIQSERIIYFSVTCFKKDVVQRDGPKSLLWIFLNREELLKYEIELLPHLSCQQRFHKHEVTPSGFPPHSVVVSHVQYVSLSLVSFEACDVESN